MQDLTMRVTEEDVQEIDNTKMMNVTDKLMMKTKGSQSTGKETLDEMSDDEAEHEVADDEAEDGGSGR
jgi:hypothetical protein